MAALVLSIAGNYRHLLAPATNFGKNFMPRVAAKLDVAQISEISAVVSADTFVRPIYAGNALATVQSKDPIKVITVRSTAFDPAGAGGNRLMVTSTPDNLTALAAIIDLLDTPAIVEGVRVRFVRLVHADAATVAGFITTPIEQAIAQVVRSAGRHGAHQREQGQYPEHHIVQCAQSAPASQSTVHSFIHHAAMVSSPHALLAPHRYADLDFSGSEDPHGTGLARPLRRSSCRGCRTVGCRTHGGPHGPGRGAAAPLS
jgi:hypothetical protein